MSKNDWKFGVPCRGYERRDLGYATDRKMRGENQPSAGIRKRVLDEYKKNGPEAAWKLVQKENEKLSERGIKYTYEIFLKWIREEKLKNRSNASKGKDDDAR